MMSQDGVKYASPPVMQHDDIEYISPLVMQQDDIKYEPPPVDSPWPNAIAPTSLEGVNITYQILGVILTSPDV